MNYLVVAAPEKVNLTVAVLLASCPISMYTAKVKIDVKPKNNRHIDLPCWPVLIPQITGLLSPDVPVTIKESTQL